MSASDQARAAVLVRVPPAEAFRVFTEEIDQWWRRGKKYRAVGGKRRGVIHMEPHEGGRLFESIGSHVIETGRVTVFEPPTRLAFEWCPVNFAPTETTLVEVDFASSPSGTLVTVTHSGWASIRLDHPARHGEDVPEFLRRLGLWWGDQVTSLRLFAED